MIAKFSTADNLEVMVDKMLVYCGQFLRWDELLAEVKGENPQQFDRFASRLQEHVIEPAWGPAPSTPSFPGTLMEGPSAPFQVPRDAPLFVGRENELAQFSEVVSLESAHSIYCIVGMGGIGKTALAIHVAHKLRYHFTGGVLWADAATSDPLAILDNWAGAYGSDFSRLPDLGSRAAAVRRLLADKKILMILDDVRRADRVRPLLPGGPQCTILLTTRDLELAAALKAYVYPLSPLTLSESQQLMASILGSERMVAEEDAANEICELAGNLPLAIEIAAQRLNSRQRWKLADLAERLRDEKKRLEALKMHDEEVRASFIVSWEALETDQCQDFSQLAVFGGRAFAVPAFAAVAQVDDADEAEDRLYALVMLSLLAEEGEQYFRQHPLLSDFAREQLMEDDAAYERMIGYYLGYASAHRNDYAALEHEWDSLSACMELAHQRRMWQTVIDCAEALADVWFAWGRFSEARQGYGWATECARSLGETQTEAHCLLQWGRACIHQSDYTEAKTRLTASLQLYLELDDLAGIADVKYELAEIAEIQADFDKANSNLTEILNIRKDQLHDSLGVAAVLYKLADIEYAQGHHKEAEKLGQQALEIRNAADDKSGCIQTRRLLADVAISLENYELAERHCQRALSLCDELQEKRARALALYSLCTVHLQRGNTDMARACGEESLSLLEVMADRRSQAQVLWFLSRIDMAEERHDSALEKAMRSYELCTELDDLWGRIFLMSHLGDVHIKFHQPAKAREIWQTALAVAATQRHPLTDSLRERLKQLDQADLIIAPRETMS